MQTVFDIQFMLLEALAELLTGKEVNVVRDFEDDVTGTCPDCGGDQWKRCCVLCGRLEPTPQEAEATDRRYERLHQVGQVGNLEDSWACHASMCLDMENITPTERADYQSELTHHNKRAEKAWRIYDKFYERRQS